MRRSVLLLLVSSACRAACATIINLSQAGTVQVVLDERGQAEHVKCPPEGCTSLLQTARTIRPSSEDVTASLTDQVNVLAGTDSASSFSRGNALPIVARPFGFNHWAVQSRDVSGWWFHPSDKEFHGLRCTHQPSPWIGDYGHFLIKPALQEAGGKLRYDTTSSKFRPHLFSTTLTSGEDDIQFEMVPSAHGATVRVGFPEGRAGSLLFQLPFGMSKPWAVNEHHVAGAGSSSDDRGDVLSVVVESPEDEGTEWTMHGDSVAELKFPASAAGHKSVVRLATSFISESQALLNLQRELDGKSFDLLEAESLKEWEDLLSRVTVEFAEPERSEVFYSNLYRGLLFPRFLQEYNEDGKAMHFSPYTRDVREGKLVTDEGFWDAYSTHYPMLSLLYPDKLGEIIDGWVTAYEERGWLPTWSSFNQRNCMVGTMGDCSLADAVVKSSQGLVDGFDREKAFAAIYKDATVQPEGEDLAADLGRAALKAYVEKGYAPSDHTDILSVARDQSAALTLNYNLADACIALAAEALDRKEDAEMLRERSKSFRNIFDSSKKYFRPRRLDGSWAGSFDPVTWGNGFTEASAAQYRFYAPHDVAGLAELMGGREELCQKIHEMFEQPPGFNVGSYGSVIHEMSEAQEVGKKKFGLYAHNNQPVHHVLYVAASSGCRSMAQKNLRRVMRKLYTKNGWSGDEDTGEMSSWYVLSALGLYSLVPGSDDLVIGSPEVTTAQLKIPGRPDLTIKAPGNSPEAVYIQSVQLNGDAVEGTAVQYTKLAREGGTLLFEMSKTPSDAW